ncbi:CKLF-like MARVEL transmembrane domain-containing protein 6 [Carcharodon carcharias]|uniref:CKLF-like MARVEL transmembrane domain-containing protein 6 n=1 Tax=Carcharodon carcharias TaxID=13397 RepID=UPI001B7E1192|nr:CKLF-like MARVEL transmembrane domain-containing protein 6 [Carcharodon carcharias]XP_041040768.1 CKLF-like MARVEL transmembrane domain-containing protein 6 [Carcharodon carcharias]XP_041040769.1 CKLF-like MARVEL transmembrane domain-containing protein 6 [Carcharodon carcharias]XP_041040770.1 CKLF-like MARVEL transmembrane domain-containing protein 6 [Carcharodon carcharias]
MPLRQEHGNGDMDPEGVYQTTTEPIHGSHACCNLVYLANPRAKLKVLQVVLSFVAFILEEIVYSCMNCHALYFFEFVSCSAFLLTTFLLIILTTSLRNKLNRISWPTVDFVYTAVIAVFFLIASIVFAALNDGTAVEGASVAFGFLATIAFTLDVVLHYKREGLPWKKKEDKPADSKKVPENVKGETEPLNEPGNPAV